MEKQQALVLREQLRVKEIEKAKFQNALQVVSDDNHTLLAQFEKLKERYQRLIEQNNNMVLSNYNVAGELSASNRKLPGPDSQLLNSGNPNSGRVSRGRKEAGVEKALFERNEAGDDFSFSRTGEKRDFSSKRKLRISLHSNFDDSKVRSCDKRRVNCDEFGVLRNYIMKPGFEVEDAAGIDCKSVLLINIAFLKLEVDRLSRRTRAPN